MLGLARTNHAMIKNVLFRLFQMQSHGSAVFIIIGGNICADTKVIEPRVLLAARVTLQSCMGTLETYTVRTFGLGGAHTITSLPNPPIGQVRHTKPGEAADDTTMIYQSLWTLV